MQSNSNSEVDTDKKGMPCTANNIITKLSFPSVKSKNTIHNDKVKLENTISSIKSSSLSESSSSLSSSLSPHQNSIMLKRVQLNSSNDDNNNSNHSESQSCKSEKELLENLKNPEGNQKEHKSHGIRNVYYYSPPAKKFVVREHGPFTARPHYYYNNHNHYHHFHHHHSHGELEKELQLSSLPGSESNSEGSNIQKEYTGVSTSNVIFNNMINNNNNDRNNNNDDSNDNQIVHVSSMTTARSCCSSSISSVSETMLPIALHEKEFNTEGTKRENHIVTIKKEQPITMDCDSAKTKEEEHQENVEEFVEKEKEDPKNYKNRNELQHLSKLDLAELEKVKRSFLVDSQFRLSETTTRTTTPTERNQLQEKTREEEDKVQKEEKVNEDDTNNSNEHKAIVTHKVITTAKSPSVKTERISSLHESFSSVSISPLSRKGSNLSASQIAERVQRKSFIVGAEKNVNDMTINKYNNAKSKQNIFTMNNNSNWASKSINAISKCQCEVDQITKKVEEETEATQKSNALPGTASVNTVHFDYTDYNIMNNEKRPRNKDYSNQSENVLQDMNVQERHNDEVEQYTSQLLCNRTSHPLQWESRRQSTSNKWESRLEESRLEEKLEEKQQHEIEVDKKDDSESHSSPLPRLPISLPTTTKSKEVQNNLTHCQSDAEKDTINETPTSIINSTSTTNETSKDRLTNTKLENKNNKNSEMYNQNVNINNSNLISSELTQSYQSLSPTLLRSSNFLSISSMTNNNNNNTNNNYNSINLQHSTPLDNSHSHSNIDNNNENSETNTTSVKDSLRQMTSTSFTPNTTLVISPISEVSDYFATYERNLSELLQHNSLANKWKLKEENHDSTNNNKNNNNQEKVIASGHNTKSEKEMNESNLFEKKNNISSFYKDEMNNQNCIVINEIENDEKCDQVSVKETSNTNHHHDIVDTEDEDLDDDDDDFHYSVSLPSPSLSPSLNVSFASEQHKGLHYFAPFRTSLQNNNMTNTNTNTTYNNVSKVMNANEDNDGQYIPTNTNENYDNNYTTRNVVNNNMLQAARSMDVESCYVPLSTTVSVSTIGDHASSPILYSSPLLTRPTVNENWTSSNININHNINNYDNMDINNACSNFNNYNNNMNSNSFSVSSSISSTTTPLANTNASITLIHVDPTLNMNMNNNTTEYDVENEEEIDGKEHNELSHTLAERPEHWPSPPIPVMRRPPIVPLNENDLNSENHTVRTPFLLYSNHKDKHHTHNNNNNEEEEKEEQEIAYKTSNDNEFKEKKKKKNDVLNGEEYRREELSEGVQSQEVHQNTIIDNTTEISENNKNINNNSDDDDDQNSSMKIKIESEGDNEIHERDETTENVRLMEKDVAEVSFTKNNEVHVHNAEEKTNIPRKNDNHEHEETKMREDAHGVNSKEEAITRSNNETNSTRKTSLPNDLRAQLQELERFEAENEAALTHYSKLSHRRRHNRTVTHQLFWSHSSKLQASQRETEKTDEESTSNTTSSEYLTKSKQEEAKRNSDIISKESPVKQENAHPDQSMHNEEKEQKQNKEKTEMPDLSGEYEKQEMQTNQDKEEEEEQELTNAEMKKEIPQSEPLCSSPIDNTKTNNSNVNTDSLQDVKKENNNNDSETENNEASNYRTKNNKSEEDKHLKESNTMSEKCPIKEQESATLTNTHVKNEETTRTSEEENKMETHAMPIPSHTSYASSRFKFFKVERDQQRARVEAIEQFCHFAAKERHTNNSNNNKNVNNNEKNEKDEFTSAPNTNTLNIHANASPSLPLQPPLSLRSNNELQIKHEHHEQEKEENELEKRGKESVFTRLSRSKSPYFSKMVHVHEKAKKMKVKNDKNTTHDNSKSKRNHFLENNNISEANAEVNWTQKTNTLGEHDKSNTLTFKNSNVNSNNNKEQKTIHNATKTKLTKQGVDEGENECRLEKFRSIKSACSLNSVNTNHHKYNITFMDNSISENIHERPLPLSSVEFSRRAIHRSKCRAISTPPERRVKNNKWQKIQSKLETDESVSECHKMNKRSVVTFALPTYTEQYDLEEEESSCEEKMKKMKTDRNKCKEHRQPINKRRNNNNNNHNNHNHMENSSSTSSSISNSKEVYKKNNDTNKTESLMGEKTKYDRAATTFTRLLRSSSPSSRTSTLLPEKMKSSLSSSELSSLTPFVLSHEKDMREKENKASHELNTRIHIPSQRVRRLEENGKSQKGLKQNEVERFKNINHVDDVIIKVNKCNYDKENVQQKFVRFTRTHSPAKGKATVVAQIENSKYKDSKTNYHESNQNVIADRCNTHEDQSKEREKAKEADDDYVEKKLLHKQSMVHGKEMPLEHNLEKRSESAELFLPASCTEHEQRKIEINKKFQELIKQEMLLHYVSFLIFFSFSKQEQNVVLQELTSIFNKLSTLLSELIEQVLSLCR